MKYSMVLLVCLALVISFEPIDSKMLGLFGSKVMLPAKFGGAGAMNTSSICGMTALLPAKLKDTLTIGYCSVQCVREGKRFGYCNESNVCQCVDVANGATNGTTAAPANGSTAAANGSPTTASAEATTATLPARNRNH